MPSSRRMWPRSSPGGSPVLGVLALLQRWHAAWRDPELGPILRRLLAENAALAGMLGGAERGHY